MNPERYMPKPLNKAIVDFDTAVNEDIRTALEKNFDTYAYQCKKLAPVFKGVTCEETANNIWKFLRRKCNYVRDPDNNQMIRTPSYFVNHNREGDCKTFALFARCVYACLYPDLKTSFKYVNYRGGDVPTHVYTVVKNKNGDNIIIDGCWLKFNSEKNYRFALPLKLKAMKVTTLAGIDGLGFVPKQNLSKKQKKLVINRMNNKLAFAMRDRLKQSLKLRRNATDNLKLFKAGRIDKATYIKNRKRILQDLNKLRAGKPIGKLSKADKKKKRAERKAKRKAKLKKSNAKAKKVFTKIGRGLNTVALAPVRGAFLAVVAVNVNGLASNLKILYDLKKSGKDKQPWEKVLKIWKNVGGFEKILLKTINKGAKKKKLFLSKKAKARWEKNHPKGVSGTDTLLLEDRNTIGHPAVIAAAIAAAAGVIGALIPVIMQALKKNGMEQQAEEVAAQGEDLVEQTKQGEGYQQAFQGSNEGVIPQIAGDGSPVEELPEAEEMETLESEESELDGEDVPEGDMAEVEDVINSCYSGSIGAMDADTTASLITNLGKVAGAALDFTQTVVKKKAKKNPKLAKVLNTGNQVAEAVIANKYVKGSGVPVPAPFLIKPKKKTASSGGFKITPLVAVGGLAALGLAVYAIKK